jgi:hypothetical protein
LTTREASCSCGQLRLVADGDPIRVSVCHCLACQQRTGSAFGVQARFDDSQIRIEGRWKDYTRISDDGEPRTFSFCPDCGATVFYRLPVFPGMTAVPVGAFADPTFPAPVRSIYDGRQHPWLTLREPIEHETD